MKTTASLFFLMLLSANSFCQLSEDKPAQKPVEKQAKTSNGNQYFASAELANTVRTMQNYTEQNEVPTLNTTKPELKVAEMTQALNAIKEWKGTKYKGVYQ